MDTKAVNHILMNNYTYQKPSHAKYNLTTIVGGGVLVAEEDMHRRQVGSNRPFFDRFSPTCLFFFAAENHGMIRGQGDYGYSILPSVRILLSEPFKYES